VSLSGTRAAVGDRRLEAASLLSTKGSHDPTGLRISSTPTRSTAGSSWAASQPHGNGTIQPYGNLAVRS
jgi:hypothetical protein